MTCSELAQCNDDLASARELYQKTAALLHALQEQHELMVSQHENEQQAHETVSREMHTVEQLLKQAQSDASEANALRLQMHEELCAVQSKLAESEAAAVRAAKEAESRKAEAIAVCVLGSVCVSPFLLLFG